MNTATKVLLVVVTALVIFAYWEGRQVGAARVELKSLQHADDSLREVLASREEKFRVDTVRIFRSITTVDTLLQHRIDTAIVHQTDTVKITITEAKATQDTIRACRLLVSDCAAGWNVEKELNTNLRGQIRVLEKSRPSQVSIWAWRALSFEFGRLSAGKLP